MCSECRFVSSAMLGKLVARVPSPADRRRVLVQLTRRGEKVLEKISALNRAELRRVGPEIKRLLGQLDAAGET